MSAPDSAAPSVLVAGASGMLGQALVRALARRHPGVRVATPDEREMDLTDRERVMALVDRVGPRWIFNAAAYTLVDDAETHAELAQAVNGRGAGHLAGAARRAGARLVHVSTDYVFDGTKPEPYVEDDPTSPLGVYGRSKLAGERAVVEAGADALIVRSAWLFGPGDRPNFVDTIRRLLATRPRLAVVDDQRGCPTYAPDLADACVELAAHRATGVVHVTNSGSCSWYEFACEIARGVGSEVPLEPVDSSAFPRPAPRPANSVLDCSRFRTITGRALRDWREALADHLRRCSGPSVPS